MVGKAVLKQSCKNIKNKNGRKMVFREVVQKYSCPDTPGGGIPVKNINTGGAKIFILG